MSAFVRVGGWDEVTLLFLAVVQWFSGSVVQWFSGSVVRLWFDCGLTVV